MYLARKESGRKATVYLVDDYEFDADENRAVEKTERKLRFSPRLGGGSGGKPSTLCGRGVAAVRTTAGEALAAVGG